MTREGSSRCRWRAGPRLPEARSPWTFHGRLMDGPRETGVSAPVPLRLAELISLTASVRLLRGGVSRKTGPMRVQYRSGVSDRIVESLTAPHKTADVSIMKSRRSVYFDSPLLVHSQGPSRWSSLRSGVEGSACVGGVKRVLSSTPASSKQRISASRRAARPMSGTARAAPLASSKRRRRSRSC